ncbi:MAG: phosphodiester glycosidase family protein, partial [Solirubrobacterales bacterium]
MLSHGDGLRTTIQVAEYPLKDFELRVATLPTAMTLLEWCEWQGAGEALVGGFYIRQPQVETDPLLSGMPLGELRASGVRSDSVPFDPPWDERRACVHSVGGEVTIAPRDELPGQLEGDLLQAGPMLVADGRPADQEREGFSAGSGQFDSDITDGRHPRAALGLRGGTMLALVTDGRTDQEAGLTLDELATQMIDLGVTSALNLDGGGSASMIRDGQLVNVPREGDGTEIPGGRPVSTALVFLSRR